VIPSARYAHTNLIAEDWRRLAAFYQEVFDCKLEPPERDYRGESLDRGTGLNEAHLTGAHLRLPGFGAGGPTLEIYHYEPMLARRADDVNRPGFGHIAFAVDDVEAARQAVMQAGGSAVGEVVSMRRTDGRTVTWCYVRDPEGNMLELQAWDG
jgi:predicted enzyme related to lactoylglutathione lyase